MTAPRTIGELRKACPQWHIASGRMGGLNEYRVSIRVPGSMVTLRAERIIKADAIAEAYAKAKAHEEKLK